MSDSVSINDHILPPIAGEFVPPGEAEAIQVILAAIEKQVREAAIKSPPARRDAHAKADGCVKAEFRVLDNLPPALRVGVFAVPRTFEAWIRFSNGSGTPQSDYIPDGRGMAIKLMGVTDSPSTTQDFLMINNPAFFVPNAVDYVVLQTAGPLKFFFPSFNPFQFRFHELGVALRLALQWVRNPFNIRYWSMAPYRCGDQACKYSARPSGTLSAFTAAGSPNFLRNNMASQLAKAGVTFDFMVQLRTDPATMPIEDPTITWSEAAAPFATVAHITIPTQSFESPEQDAFCENLSFTPWHCVDALQPLGGINRVRRIVYEQISLLRHGLNHAPRKEPTGFTI
jgi:hypothetical protein